MHGIQLINELILPFVCVLDNPQVITVYDSICDKSVLCKMQEDCKVKCKVRFNTVTLHVLGYNLCVLW